MKRILAVDTANVWAIVIDAASISIGNEMATRAVAPVQMLGLGRAVHQLAAPPALRTGEGRRHFANDVSQLRVLSALPTS